MSRRCSARVSVACTSILGNDNSILSTSTVVASINGAAMLVATIRCSMVGGRLCRSSTRSMRLKLGFGRHRPSFGIAPRSVIVHRIHLRHEHMPHICVDCAHTRNACHTILTSSTTDLAAKKTVLKASTTRNKPHIARNPRGERTLAHHGDHRGQGTIFGSTSKRTRTDEMRRRSSKSRMRWPRRRRTRPHPSIWDN